MLSCSPEGFIEILTVGCMPVGKSDIPVTTMSAGANRRQPRAILNAGRNDDPLAHPADSHDRESAGILNGLVC